MKVKNIKKVRFLRFRDFIWLFFLLALYAAIQHGGLPHLRWEYSWRDQGQGYDPWADRYYTRCTYLGFYGAYTDHFPQDGQCALIRFLKPDA